MSSFYVTSILVRLYFKGLYSTTSLPRSSSQQLYLRFEISKIFMLSSIWLHKCPLERMPHEVPAHKIR